MVVRRWGDKSGEKTSREKKEKGVRESKDSSSQHTPKKKLYRDNLEKYFNFLLTVF